MENEERDDGEGVVIEDALIEIEAVVRMYPVGDIHFTRQEQKMIPISLPRVKWLERAEA